MDLTRRDAIHASGAGLLATLAAGPGLAREPSDDADDGAAPADREFVMAAGMTEAEAACWAATAEAAGAFFALPELHPMDRQEVASAIHIIQNKLLGRPTYRRYLELAKAAHEGGDAGGAR